MSTKLTLSVNRCPLSVCRLPPGSPVPSWAVDSSFFSATGTPEELSVVCDSRSVPPGIVAEDGWIAFKVEGPLDFALTGILSSLAAPLADAGISIFALSTYDTDYILVREECMEETAAILGGFCLINR